MAMKFLDCNCYFGLPAKPGPSPADCPTLEDLVGQLNRAGIERAVVWHMAQHDVSPPRGNELLSEAIGQYPDLLGCWTILPPQTGELNVDPFLAAMKASNVVALRAFPVAHRYLLDRVTLGPLLEAMIERRIPLLYSVRKLPGYYSPHQAWNDLHVLMADFPGLTLIVTDHGTWGSDRYFRPLLDRYPRVHVDTTLYFLDGGIEELVRRYGAGRLVFGSGLPERYPGGMMLAIRHAEIDEASKAAIAGGNMARLAQEVLG